MDSTDLARPAQDNAVSPRQNAPPIERTVQSLRNLNNPLNTLDLRADPDAQATVTDFLDFTEYLPSDMMRSLTLIGNLDQTYVDASTALDELTSQWGQLPSMAPADRPRPVELRAQISEKLHQTVSSRVYAHAEALRMSENLSRHYNRIKIIASKLETMLQNYPAESEIKSPVATTKSPVASKLALRMDGSRVRRPHVPRITIPGEVLAPYELNYDAYTSEEDSSEEDDEDQDAIAPVRRSTPDGPTRIKVVKSTVKPPKPGKIPKPRTSVPPPSVPGGHMISTSSALAQLKPPPENVVIGSADAPWGQLTPYELARLRKRMKKNVSWTPSDTMVARELSYLKRGVEAFNAAKRKAEEEGKPFEGKMPEPIVDQDTGEERMPLGALTVQTLASDERNLSNRGMKLNEAKKLKREMLAKMAAEEAEESAKNFKFLADALMNGSHHVLPSVAQEQANKAAAASKAKPPPKKRKRDSAPEAESEKPELAAEGQTQKPQFKRTKTETPIPAPQLSAGNSQASQVAHETPVQPPQRPVVHSTTPIPLPFQGQDQSITAKSGTSVASATSPAPSSTAGPTTATSTTLVPLKLPGAETPIPPPVYPVRETRKAQATRLQEQKQHELDTSSAPLAVNPASRGTSPTTIPLKPDPDTLLAASPTTPLPPATWVAPNTTTTNPTTTTTTTTTTRRPASRGKASSQEPQPTLAAERQRRASTARNTPAPSEPARPSSRRQQKRPAPGVISRTVSGGNSAVGKRKAAPKKKSRAAGKAAPKDHKASAVDAAAAGDAEVEVDDEGNVIDPDEARYCLCNRVSFGTMIQCDNIDNCKQEWFHLECVGLAAIPARTTKWYCPDCRVLLNIGEKGEVSARGVRA